MTWEPSTEDVHEALRHGYYTGSGYDTAALQQLDQMEMAEFGRRWIEHVTTHKPECQRRREIDNTHDYCQCQCHIRVLKD